VYAYPAEHHPAWRREPGTDLQWAAFGENLTTEGLAEDVRIGDLFRIGTAEYVVAQPQQPCDFFHVNCGPFSLLRPSARGHVQVPAEPFLIGRQHLPCEVRAPGRERFPPAP
jgi:hypothetical protein